MKTTTTAYKTAMSGQARPQGYIRIQVYGSSTYTFYKSNIVSAKKEHKSDVLSRTRPVENFTFAIKDPTGVFNPENRTGQWLALSSKTKVEVTWGLVINGSNYLISSYKDTYYLDGRPTYKDRIATFRCSSMLSHLDVKATVSGLAGEGVAMAHTTKQIAEALCDGTGAVTAGKLATNFDTAFTNLSFIPYGLKDETLRDQIQQVAHAIGGMYYTIGTTVYFKVINPITATSAWTMSRRDVILGGEVCEVKTDVQRVSVKEYSYGYESPSVTIFDGTFAVQAGQTVRIDYGSRIAYPGTMAVVMVGLNYGDVVYTKKEGLHSVELTITSGSGEITVSVESLTPKTDSRVVSIDYSNSDGITETVDNPLIYTDSQANVLSSQTYNWAKQNVYTIQTRGNPEVEVGDVITYKDQSSRSVKCLVTGIEVSYDGAYSGKLTLVTCPATVQLGAPELVKATSILTPNISTPSYVPFMSGANMYVDGVWKQSINAGKSFDLEDFVSDTLPHTVYAAAYGAGGISQGYANSIKSNTIQASGSSAIRYATPTVYYDEWEDGPCVMALDIDSAANQIEIYIDGALYKTTNIYDTVTIEGTTYTRLTDSTWSEWIVSTYNTSGFIASNGQIKRGTQHVVWEMYPGAGLIDVAPGNMFSDVGLYKLV